MYSFDDPRCIELAYRQPEKFVLKPQREGGGNNIYRLAIPDFLDSISEGERHAYILMELIEPPERQGAILRDGQVKSGSVINEVGTFGCILWDEENTTDANIILNRYAGHLVRTKFRESDEGGVAAGWACLDSLYLTD